MSGGPDAEEEVGFDERELLDEADLFTLTLDDGATLAVALLAVVEHEGAEYAVLAPADDAREGDLLVTAYREDADGAVHFTAVDDAAIIAGLEGVLADLLG
jgi:hypothetical protein